MPDTFVWYDLLVADPAAAADFYAHVVGWTAEVSMQTGFPYTLFKVGETQVGGVMGLPPGMEDMPKRWNGYVGVADVDAAAEALSAAGGTIYQPPMDIPNVGRFAVAADPQGAQFNLFTGNGEPMAPLPLMSPGSIGWHELHTSDIEAGFGFYAGLYGWEKDETHDMGPMGIYQLFRTNTKDAVGGIVREDQGYWLYYFAVEEIDAATARITEKGGTIMMGPIEVPGGAWITIARDPQEVSFAIVGMKSGG